MNSSTIRRLNSTENLCGKSEFHRISWKQFSSGIWYSRSRWIHSWTIILFAPCCSFPFMATLLHFMDYPYSIVVNSCHFWLLFLVEKQKERINFFNGLSLPTSSIRNKSWLLFFSVLSFLIPLVVHLVHDSLHLCTTLCMGRQEK